jgi:anti-sigma factor RsiW
MSEHINEWLSAYLDHELQGQRRHQVEAHLAGCPTCQAELQSLRQLSRLLKADPLPDVFPSPNRFAAQVTLRLPRRPLQPAKPRTPELGWWLAPATFLGVWVFFQAVYQLSAWVWAVSRLGLLGETADWMAPASSPTWLTSMLDQLGVFTAHTSRQLSALAEGVGWNIISQLTWLIPLALLYLSWLAIWWMRQKRQVNGQP